jgi:hypothetical protein
MPSSPRLSPSPPPYLSSSPSPNSEKPQPNRADYHNQTSLQDNSATPEAQTPIRPIYAGAAGKRPRQFTSSPESDSGPAGNTGTTKKPKRHSSLEPTDTQELALAGPKSEAERIAEGLASLEDRNALHAALGSVF